LIFSRFISFDNLQQKNMNRLGFADFHAKHFGPDQKAHWQSMLQQQQLNMYPQQQYYDYTQDQEQGEQEYYNNEEYEEYAQEEEEYEEEEQEDELQLSKEAVEIFRFSEAYRKEREEERLKEEEEDQEGMEDWQYDESTVHISGGIEAPATSLILTKKRNEKEEKSKKSNKITIQEELLNSAYLLSCTSSGNDAPVILWPVLPFKM
jgi:hypothetical protein